MTSTITIGHTGRVTPATREKIESIASHVSSWEEWPGAVQALAKAILEMNDNAEAINELRSAIEFLERRATEIEEKFPVEGANPLTQEHRERAAGLVNVVAALGGQT